MSGKPEIEHDQIRLVALDGFERRARPLIADRHLVAARRSSGATVADDVRLVVDDEDARGHDSTPSTGAARTGPGTTMVNRRAGARHVLCPDAAARPPQAGRG